MSWSVQALGKPMAVKVALATQFTSALSSTLHMKAEHEAVQSIERAIDVQLDFLVEHNPDALVRISASGSASQAPKDATWKSTIGSGFSFEFMGNILE